MPPATTRARCLRSSWSDRSVDHQRPAHTRPPSGGCGRIVCCGPLITVDSHLAPLIVIRFVGPNTDDEFKAYLAELSALVKRQQPQVSIVDATQASPPTSTQRQLQVAWMRAEEEGMKRHGLGTALVIDSAPIRMALNLMLMVKPMVIPHLVTSSFGEALQWALTQLE